MSRFFHLLSIGLMSISVSAWAEDAAPENYYKGEVNNSVNAVGTYLKNLGRYFGYDVTTFCETGGPCNTNASGADGGYSNALLNANDTYLAQLNLYNSYLGALMGGGNTSSANPIVPSTLPNLSILNSLAGQTFISPPYAAPSSTGVSVSTLIDQKNYQADPVSQSVLNILATPNFSFCYNNDGTQQVANCPYLFREKIMKEVIGTLPGTELVFSPAYNENLVAQLNGDILLTPLLYTITANEDAQQNNTADGLVAQTQAQQAENFIRYVTNAVNPPFLPTRQVYDNLVSKAGNYSKNVAPVDQAKAQAILTDYLTNLRTYAAQTSIGVSNLYSILSKRLPQKPMGTGDNNSATTSQALNEFTMATWRLYNPGASGDSTSTQWLNKINTGSNATVQKEIAILLSEINYQMYLTRQQQERLLLTETMILLHQTQKTRPNGSDIISNYQTMDAPGSMLPIQN